MAGEERRRVGAGYFPGGERLAFFVLLVAILALAYDTIRPLLVALLLAAGVASLSHPPYLRLTGRLGGRRRIAAALGVLAVLVGILGPAAVLIVELVRRVAGELAQLGPALSSTQRRLIDWSPRFGSFGPSVRRLAERLTSTLADTLPAVVRQAGSWAGAVGGALLDFSVSLFVFGIALYYFYVDGVAWRERLVRLLPIPPGHVRAFMARFREVCVSVLVGNVGIAIFHALVSGLGYVLFGVPAPLLLALCTGAASFVPTLGTALVWTPIAVWVTATEGWVRGLLFVGWGIGPVGLTDNLIRPLLMKRGLRMHTLVVFVAVLGGVATFGVKGLFVGPLVLALAVAALDLYERE